MDHLLPRITQIFVLSVELTKTLLLVLLAQICTTFVLRAKDELWVNITALQSAAAQGAVCLDESPPAYYLHKRYGTGLHSWIIYLDVNITDESFIFIGRWLVRHYPSLSLSFNDALGFYQEEGTTKFFRRDTSKYF
ncbi:hypothetical protein KY285_033607 [Solanum tuberosum]|nr:hypothetical protein KY285_033607 [Solanum tuberosum]